MRYRHRSFYPRLLTQNQHRRTRPLGGLDIAFDLAVDSQAPSKSNIALNQSTHADQTVDSSLWLAIVSLPEHVPLYGRLPFAKGDFGCVGTDRLQFYIRPVVQESLLALMESADPRLILLKDSKSLNTMQAWRVTV